MHASHFKAVKVAKRGTMTVSWRLKRALSFRVDVACRRWYRMIQCGVVRHKGTEPLRGATHSADAGLSCVSRRHELAMINEIETYIALVISIASFVMALIAFRRSQYGRLLPQAHYETEIDTITVRLVNTGSRVLSVAKLDIAYGIDVASAERFIELTGLMGERALPVGHDRLLKISRDELIDAARSCQLRQSRYCRLWLRGRISGGAQFATIVDVDGFRHREGTLDSARPYVASDALVGFAEMDSVIFPPPIK